ncbi:DUF302 domain-containing protein [[Mycobacterium] burgundiense]|uniref:DUF302 domain-containing protein n=1 Tax=[Mycobacterium] burgundiense TaxID=3064286 RepID=A0ABM9LM24_9MYCO|nr:DUF302 domain-containing protein [Mycolicibacterium sp. MU0053]CAJ1501379.1 DUF302 domain-containing protein [Mycolicibacterium sp. MU0053]
MAERREIPFEGLRLRYGSTQGFDALVAALYDAVGSAPVPIDDIAVRFGDWDSYEREIQSHVGPSGFMLFAVFNHGGWIRKAGIDRQVLRVVIGNPLIAITLLRHDVTAGLFAPVELLLTAEDDGSALTYVQPSSLMVVEDNPALLAAATVLDTKLAQLAADVTG